MVIQAERNAKLTIDDELGRDNDLEISIEYEYGFESYTFLNKDQVVQLYEHLKKVLKIE